jgi:hypothetical protein
LSTGLPALDLPALDPLIVPEVLLDYRSDAAEVKMSVRNSEARGLKDVDILDFRLVAVVTTVAYSVYTETTERRPMVGWDEVLPPLLTVVVTSLSPSGGL